MTTRGSTAVDVAAILNAVYKPAADSTDVLAGRVRSRLALMETIAECARLLVEVPLSAVTATLGTTPADDSGEQS